MAEWLLSHFYGHRYEGFSAGATSTRVHPFASARYSPINMMEKRGVLMWDWFLVTDL